MYVAEAEHIVRPHHICAVEAAVIPNGTDGVAVVILHSGHCSRRSHLVVLAEPLATLTEGLDTHHTLLAVVGNARYLHLVATTYAVPREGVLLTYVDIVVVQAGLGEHSIEVPIYPLGVVTYTVARRLQRDDILHAADTRIVLIDRVAAQHTEDRYRNLSIFGLCRHICVYAAGIVGLIPISAPKCITVCSIQFLTVAEKTVNEDGTTDYRFEVIEEAAYFDGYQTRGVRMIDGEVVYYNLQQFHKEPF